LLQKLNISLNAGEFLPKTQDFYQKLKNFCPKLKDFPQKLKISEIPGT